MSANIFSSKRTSNSPKLNENGRLLVYKELLKVVCKDPATHLGFCYYITELDSFYLVYKNSYHWSSTDLMQYELPELYSLKPIRTWYHNPNYWYSTDPIGWSRRIKLLWGLINKMEKDLQKRK